MAKHKIFDYWKGLPPWAKGVVIVVPTAAVILAGYTMYRNHQKKLEYAKDNQEAANAAKDLQALAAKGIRPSYPNTQYATMADALVAAMDGCGTDEQAVYDTFSFMKNEADVLALINAFGIKYYIPCPVSNTLTWAVDSFIKGGKMYGGALGTWIRYDMTASEVAKINKILADKGINYSF